MRDWRGDGGNGKRAPRNTRGVEQRLVLIGQPVKVLLDVRSQIRRDDVAERRQVLPGASGLARALEKLLAHQLVDHRDEEQRVSTGAMVNELRHACRKATPHRLLRYAATAGADNASSTNSTHCACGRRSARRERSGCARPRTSSGR